MQCFSGSNRGGGATCVNVMHNALEQFGDGAAIGHSSDGNSLSSCYNCGESAETAAAVSGLQGLMKEVVLAFKKVQPEAACRTCCFEGIIESSNFAKISMPRRGVAGETDGTAAKTPGGNLLAFGSYQVWTCVRRRTGMK